MSMDKPSTRPAYDIRNFGAVPNTTELQTQAIQASIDTCSDNGGGEVRFPAGDYSSGQLFLKSKVTLYLENGATLRNAPDPKGFRLVSESIDGSFRDKILERHPFISARNACDLVIKGDGCIDGGGENPGTWTDDQGRKIRPQLLSLQNCERIKILGVRFCNARMWTLHLEGCRNCLVDGISIENALVGEPHFHTNTDGIDPDGCENMVISNCRIRCNDDCVVIKSTTGRSSRNITVSNCILTTDCYALKLGTESIGEFSNIQFSNCVIDGPGGGLFLSLRDGGSFRNILASNLQIKSEGPYAIEVEIEPRREDIDFSKAAMEFIRFTNLNIETSKTMRFSGQETIPIRHVRLSDIMWIRKPGESTHVGHFSNVVDLNLDDVTIIDLPGTGPLPEPFQFQNCDKVSR